MSFTVTRDRLWVNIGQVNVLLEALAAKESGRRSFWQMESTESLFSSLNVDDPISRYYGDLSQLIEPIFQQFFAQIEHLNSNSIEVDFPDSIDFPYVMIGESFEAANGFFSRFAIVTKEQSK